MSRSPSRAIGVATPALWGSVALAALLLAPGPTGTDLSRVSGVRAPVVLLSAATPVGPSAGPSLDWTNLANYTTGPTPGARSYPGLVHDPADTVTMLFGGQLPNGSALSDTWTLGSSWEWAARSPTVSPSARWAPALAYDAGLRSVVMFGGDGPGGAFDGDTWIYAAGNWSPIAPAVAPSPRGFALLLPSPNGSGLILTGGFGPAGRLNGSWYFHDGNWTDLTPVVGPGPTPRYGAAGAFWAGVPEDVVFGGNGTNGSVTGAGIELGDTWTFNGSGWSELPTVTGGTPVPREGASLSVDPLDGELLLFGGRSNTLGTLLNPVWAFNGTRWSQPPLVGADRPHVRFGAGLAPAGPGALPVVLLFGGGNGNGSAYPGSWTIASRAPLLVAAPSASRPQVDSGFPVVLNASPIGGVPPYQFRWSGLPAPCTGAGSAGPICTPTSNASVAVYYRPKVTVTDSAGTSFTSPTGSVEVNGPLRIERLVLSPSPVAAGTALTLNVTISGGGGPVRYEYSGLPDGCASENLSTYSCLPSASGDFYVIVTVVDTFGLNASLGSTVTVSAPGLGIWQIAGLAIAIGGAAALVVIVLRARRRPKPPLPSRPRGSQPPEAAGRSTAGPGTREEGPPPP